MSTNLDLSELYKLKSLCNNEKHAEEHTYNNLTVIESIPHDVEVSGSSLENVKTPIVEQVVKEIKEVHKYVEPLNTINSEVEEEEAHDEISR